MTSLTVGWICEDEEDVVVVSLEADFVVVVVIVMGGYLNELVEGLVIKSMYGCLDGWMDK